MVEMRAEGSDQMSTPRNELLAALTGGSADRDRATAHRTRGVVLASAGVLHDQRAGRKRVRGVALAATFGILLLLAPLLWWAADNLIGGEHFGDLPCEFSMWVCILCPALLAVAIMAGWLRIRR